MFITLAVNVLLDPTYPQSQLGQLGILRVWSSSNSFKEYLQLNLLLYESVREQPKFYKNFYDKLYFFHFWFYFYLFNYEQNE